MDRADCDSAVLDRGFAHLDSLATLEKNRDGRAGFGHRSINKPCHKSGRQSGHDPDPITLRCFFDSRFRQRIRPLGMLLISHGASWPGPSQISLESNARVAKRVRTTTPAKD